jgi:hypothetical protein
MLESHQVTCTAPCEAGPRRARLEPVEEEQDRGHAGAGEGRGRGGPAGGHAEQRAQVDQRGQQDGAGHHLLVRLPRMARARTGRSRGPARGCAGLGAWRSGQSGRRPHAQATRQWRAARRAAPRAGPSTSVPVRPHLRALLPNSTWTRACPRKPGARLKGALRSPSGGRWPPSGSAQRALPAWTRSPEQERAQARARGPRLHARERALGLQRAHARLELAALQLAHRDRHVLDQVGPLEQVPHRAVLPPRPRARDASVSATASDHAGSARPGAHQGLTAACNSARALPPAPTCSYSLSGTAALKVGPSAAHWSLGDVPGEAAAARRASSAPSRARACTASRLPSSLRSLAICGLPSSSSSRA